MLKENQDVKMTWNGRNKNYYIEKGYNFTKIGDKFSVKTSDLPNGSGVKVKVICDYCGIEYTLPYQKYNRILNALNSKCACKNCLGKKFSETSSYGNTNRANNKKRAKISSRVTLQRNNFYYDSVVKYCKTNDYVLCTKKEDIRTLKSLVTFECKKHGINTTTLESILNNHKCYRCCRESAFKIRYTNDLHQRQKSLYDKALKACEKLNYTLLSQIDDIKNNTTYIQYNCPIHGTQTMRISNLISGKRCPKCRAEKASGLFRLSVSDVRARIEMFGGFVDNPEEYINITTKNLKIHCPMCGCVFISSLRNFTQHSGQLCNQCTKKESVGESKIQLFLDYHNIHYEKEKWFPDCRDIKPLPFDFYLPNHNLIIEFDGRQHFDNNHLFSHTNTNIVQKHDEIKNNYCKSRNIDLIRIPYWDIDNISNILSQRLIS